VARSIRVPPYPHPADAELAAADIGQESIGDQLIDGLVDQLGAVEIAFPVFVLCST